MVEAIKELADLDIVHVPFKGTGPAAQALFAGQVQVGVPSVNSALPFIEEGAIVPIAVLRSKRLAQLPGLPTVKEELPKFQQPPGWIGMLGPAGLPAPIVKRLNAAVVKGSHGPKVVAYLENGGNELIANSPEEAAAEIKSGLAITARMIESLGLKKQ
jgi:tripartite-type tricarboxylate transporter receptor subunit TctC